MSEDRLERIKQTHDKFPGGPSVIADLKWLISEVERDRKAADTVRLSNRELIRILDARDATIATLLEAIEDVLSQLDPDESGKLRKAVATAKEEA